MASHQSRAPIGPVHLHRVFFSGTAVFGFFPRACSGANGEDLRFPGRMWSNPRAIFLCLCFTCGPHAAFSAAAVFFVAGLRAIDFTADLGFPRVANFSLRFFLFFFSYFFFLNNLIIYSRPGKEGRTCEKFAVRNIFIHSSEYGIRVDAYWEPFRANIYIFLKKKYINK